MCGLTRAGEDSRLCSCTVCSHTRTPFLTMSSSCHPLRIVNSILMSENTLGTFADLHNPASLHVACQQHAHAGKVLYRSMALQEDRLSPCNETPSSITADIQSVKFLSQHYYKTSSREGAETVTSYRRLFLFDTAQVFYCTPTW